jgi:hypothetical protein
MYKCTHTYINVVPMSSRGRQRKKLGKGPQGQQESKTEKIYMTIYARWTWTCSIDIAMDHAYVVWTRRCRMNMGIIMQHGWTWSCRMGMDMQHGY